jgi:hypothetical protein
VLVAGLAVFMGWRITSGQAILPNGSTALVTALAAGVPTLSIALVSVLRQVRSGRA